MQKLLVLLMVLVALPPAALSAQRVATQRAGLSQPPAMIQMSRAVAPARREVKWKSGAAIGFVLGAVAGAYMTRGGDEVPAGGIIFIGVLGALVGALVEAMSSS